MARRRRKKRKRGSCLASLFALPLRVVAMVLATGLLVAGFVYGAVFFVAAAIVIFLIRVGGKIIMTYHNAPANRQIDAIDRMTGTEFEQFCYVYLQKQGFRQLRLTKSSGDQGVDIVAMKNGRRYAIQCKRYSGNVGNASVQQVVAGKSYYQCDEAIVITNSYFSPSAVELAGSNQVVLWDRDYLWRTLG